MADPEFLLDVSRLVWRAWRGGLPTGVDRVCEAYVRHYGARSLAVVQRNGLFRVLSPRHSDELFQLLAKRGPAVRARLLFLAARALRSARSSPPTPGMFYINVGHTGLNEPALPRWIARHDLRAIYLIHDLIPLTHAQYCRPGESRKHVMRLDNVLSSAAGIIGNSRVTIDAVANYAAQASRPMPPAIAAWISGHRPLAEASPRVGKHPYFLVLGTIEGRKNHELLLRVWDRLLGKYGDRAPDLMILGQRGWQADAVFAKLDEPKSFSGHVSELNGCDDRELEAYLSGARAMLMPSFAEGFGLPIIEALQLRTPVVASDLPVFREIAGEIPLYLDPTNDAAWEKSVEELAFGNGEFERQRKLMADYRAPTWEQHFALVDPWLMTLPR